MSHHAPALADIRSDVSRRNRSSPGAVGDKFPDAVLIHLGHTTGVRTQNRENNPMQSRMAWLAALRPLASGSRDGPSSRRNPSAPKPRYGAGQRRQSCMCKRRVRARPAPMQVRSRFQCGDGSGPPCRSPNCCAPGMQRAPLHGKGAATVERRYETRPRRAAVTASDRWNCHPSDK
jgi:hypothetical protein